MEIWLGWVEVWTHPVIHPWHQQVNTSKSSQIKLWPCPELPPDVLIKHANLPEQTDQCWSDWIDCLPAVLCRPLWSRRGQKPTLEGYVVVLSSERKQPAFRTESFLFLSTFANDDWLYWSQPSISRFRWVINLLWLFQLNNKGGTKLFF